MFKYCFGFTPYPGSRVWKFLHSTDVVRGISNRNIQYRFTNLFDLRDLFILQKSPLTQYFVL